MQSLLKYGTLCMWAAALSGCAEPLQIRARSEALPLSIVLPPSSSLAGRSIDKSASIAHSSAERSALGQAIGPTSSGYEEFTPTEPQLRRQSTKARYNSGTSTVAIVEGFVEYWGNQGQQRITFDLTRGGNSLVYRTETFDHAELLPGWHTMADFVRVPVSTVCGHKLLGHTNHQGWWRPSVDATQVATVADVTYSNLAEQPDCPPDRRDEESAPAGGGAIDGHQTDEWYMCTWEVWYDRYGTELSRTLLYCVPM